MDRYESQPPIRSGASEVGGRVAAEGKTVIIGSYEQPTEVELDEQAQAQVRAVEEAREAVDRAEPGWTAEYVDRIGAE